MAQRYLITGGAGFIGSNFIQHLLTHHDDISIVNLDALTYGNHGENLEGTQGDSRYHFIHGDIRDKAALDELFATYEFDYVVHFAAESHVDHAIQDPLAFVATNIGGTANLLQCAKDAWEVAEGQYREGCKFLQISTDEVYGSLPADHPDQLFTETSPLSPHNPYAASKAAADLLVMAYFDTYGLPMNITRSSNNYGPYQFPDKLIPLMISQCLKHEPLPLYGDGLHIRDWLYVKDHCAAIDLVLAQAIPGEVYNIGGHNERTNRNVVEAIVSYFHDLVDAAVTTQLITSVPDRKAHDRRYGIDFTKLTRDLGWEPETSFNEGLSQTIEWYLSHQGWMESVSPCPWQAEPSRS